MSPSAVSSDSPCVIAIDAGTTGVRSRAIFADHQPSVADYREFTQHFVRPGWVEHDPTEIWDAVLATLTTVIEAVGRDRVAAIGITNQRETAVAWDRRTGVPLCNAIVWQDRRTADRCQQLLEAGHLDLIRERTGLIIDPYFTATKFEWMLNSTIASSGIETADLALGTIDSWLIWNLTGGEVFATDMTNASRTLLFDIDRFRWDHELCELFGVPLESLAQVVPSSGRVGVTSARCGAPAGIAVSGIAGDQQAALFGQACTSAGMAKNTYGTGSFVLLNTGPTRPATIDGMLSTIAWQLADGSVSYALEGSVFVTGAAIGWLRDGLGIIDSADQTGPLAESVPDSGGVFVVPAFTGLGAPHWDPHARGTIVGLTRGSSRAHIARATVEAIAFQVRDVVDAMAAATETDVAELRVDGGASAMDLLLQLQADQLGIVVKRPRDQETTALGAAFLAGLAEGVWPDLDAIASRWELDAEFTPSADRSSADSHHAQWLRAVERSRNWAV